MPIHHVNQKIIYASVGEPIEIEVRSGGANGYVWTIAYDTSAVSLIEHKRQPNKQTFGGSGKESFVIQLNQRARVAIELTLKAPWEDAAEEQHQLLLDSQTKRGSPISQ